MLDDISKEVNSLKEKIVSDTHIQDLDKAHESSTQGNQEKQLGKENIKSKTPIIGKLKEEKLKRVSNDSVEGSEGPD